MITKMTADEIVLQIKSGNRAVLAQAMTIIESTHPKHHGLASDILDRVMPLIGNAKRIGITGVPGAGKSTLLESLGMYLVKKGLKVAVIAIDPSSSISGGSILGDKTRMTTLLREKNSFIRPVPTRGHLGGASRTTRELTFLLEAAGYDVVIVETVGVGQSEIEVASLVDFFCLVQITGAGDELQGIKKGVMELVDAILINKDDGENRNMVQIAKRNYQNALHIMKPKYPDWQAQVLTCSALNHSGMAEIWSVIEQFYATLIPLGTIDRLRQKQYVSWMQQQIEENLVALLERIPALKANYTRIKQQVTQMSLSPRKAVEIINQQVLELINNAHAPI
jgi:LAO/AO transport system kinase